MNVTRKLTWYGSRPGIANVAAAKAPDLWLELGMAYDAKHAIDQAIEAYGKAIVGNPTTRPRSSIAPSRSRASC